MKESISIALFVGTGIACSFGTYIYFKLKNLEEKVLPPEEMAKEVLKVKLPLDKIPDDVKEALNSYSKKSEKQEMKNSYLG